MNISKKFLFLFFLFFIIPPCHSMAEGINNILNRGPEIIDAAMGIFNFVQSMGHHCESASNFAREQTHGEKHAYEKEERTTNYFEGSKLIYETNEAALKASIDAATNMMDKFLAYDHEKQQSSSRSESAQEAQDRAAEPVREMAADANFAQRDAAAPTSINVSDDAHARPEVLRDSSSAYQAHNSREYTDEQNHWRDMDQQSQNYQSSRNSDFSNTVQYREMSYNGERFVDPSKLFTSLVATDHKKLLSDLVSLSTTAQAVATQIAITFGMIPERKLAIFDCQTNYHLRNFLFDSNGHFLGAYSTKRQGQLFKIVFPSIKLYFEKNNDRRGLAAFMYERSNIPGVEDLYGHEFGDGDFIDEIFFAVPEVVNAIGNEFKRNPNMDDIANGPFVKELAHLVMLHGNREHVKAAALVESLNNSLIKGKGKISTGDYMALASIHGGLMEKRAIDDAIKEFNDPSVGLKNQKEHANVVQAVNQGLFKNSNEQQNSVNNNEINGSQGSGGLSPEDPEKDKKENAAKTKDFTTKQLEDILADAKPGERTMGRTKQFEKPGGYQEALKDFESLKPSDIKEISTGKRGTLPDGRPINVRFDSSDRRPTLEIQNRRSQIKIRYGNKRGE